MSSAKRNARYMRKCSPITITITYYQVLADSMLLKELIMIILRVSTIETTQTNPRSS